MTPAMVIFAILAATFLGIPDPLVTARENRHLSQLQDQRHPILLDPGHPGLDHHATLVDRRRDHHPSAPLLFDAPCPVNWPSYVLVFIAMAFACAGLSVLIGVISASSRMTVLWSQLFFHPFDAAWAA